MEKQTIARASEKTVGKKWTKVQIYTAAHIWTAYAYCPYRRLLDMLNGLTGPIEEFLPLSEVEVRSQDRRKATLQSAYISKANILFVREAEDGQTRGLGGEAGHKPYPFVPKWSTAVKVYMPFYTLTGQMHYAKGESVRDVLNSELRFLPMTDVEICPSAGSSELGVNFIAVNKGQLISLEELGIPLMGVRTASHFSESGQQ